MGQIAELRKRSNTFVANLGVHVAMAVEEVSDKIVDFNRDQMLKSRRADGRPIMPKYSPKYAIRKGFTNPNLFLTGEFQSEMFLSVNENNLTYFIATFDFKMPFLTKRYTDMIFGIEQRNQPKAKALTTPSIGRIYKQQVFRG